MPHIARNPDFSDLDLFFNPNPVTGDVDSLTGAAAVIRSVRNLVLLNHYEAYFHPEVGSAVKKMLFASNSVLTVQYIQRAISDVIKNFEPRVDPSTLKVQVVWSDSNKGYFCTITFFVINQPRPTIASFILKRVN